MGTNLAGMTHAVKQLGFEASAMKGAVSDATLNAKLYCLRRTCRFWGKHIRWVKVLRPTTANSFAC
jgi:hypothetical protein